MQTKQGLPPIRSTNAQVSNHTVVGIAYASRTPLLRDDPDMSGYRVCCGYLSPAISRQELEVKSGIPRHFAYLLFPGAHGVMIFFMKRTDAVVPD